MKSKVYRPHIHDPQGAIRDQVQRMTKFIGLDLTQVEWFIFRAGSQKLEEKKNLRSFWAAELQRKEAELHQATVTDKS